ncbi:MAG TPA: orotidine-5'-phosphate decarboxylase [Calditrichae bacterium]|nr:orotidine-5'-phosphate decarboxylase [Calditrichia bacterium]
MFFPRLDEVCKQKKSLLCIGLDIDIERIPPFLLTELDPLFYFNRAIVEATHDCAAAYKLNIAFYEALGIPGWDLLERTLSIMPPNVMIIADAKRGDIGNSSRKYAETFFKTFAFDAITVNPYMGFDALQPFLEYEDKGIYVLGLTSNTGALDFQYLKVDNEMPLYLKVAEKVVEWNFVYGNLGLVVGGTHANGVA